MKRSSRRVLSTDGGENEPLPVDEVPEEELEGPVDVPEEELEGPMDVPEEELEGPVDVPEEELWGTTLEARDEPRDSPLDHTRVRRRFELVLTDVDDPDAELDNVDPDAYRQLMAIVSRIARDVDGVARSPIFSDPEVDGEDYSEIIDDARTALDFARGGDGTEHETRPNLMDEGDVDPDAEAARVKRILRRVHHNGRKLRRIPIELIPGRSDPVQPGGDLTIQLNNVQPADVGLPVRVAMNQVIDSRVNTPPARGRRVSEVFIEGESLNPDPNQMERLKSFALPEDGVLRGEFVDEGNYGEVRLLAEFTDASGVTHSDRETYVILGVSENALRRLEKNRFEAEVSRIQDLADAVSYILNALGILNAFLDTMASFADSGGSVPLFGFFGDAAEAILSVTENLIQTAIHIVEIAKTKKVREWNDRNRTAHENNLSRAEEFPERGEPLPGSPESMD